MKHNFIHLIVIYTLFSIISVYYLSQDLSASTNNISDLLIYSTCSFDFSANFNIMKIFYTVFPILLIFSYIHSYISDDLSSNCAYIFCRTLKRKSWLIKLYIHVFTKLLLINFILGILKLIIFMIYGYQIYDYMNFFIILAQILILETIMQLTLILLCNVITLINCSQIGYFISISCYLINIISFYLSYLTNHKWLNFLPFTQNFVVTYNNGFIDRTNYYFSHYNVNYSFSSAIIQSCMYLFILGLLGLPIIQKKEFI